MKILLPKEQGHLFRVREKDNQDSVRLTREGDFYRIS
jgi:hypothetical protein